MEVNVNYASLAAHHPSGKIIGRYFLIPNPKLLGESEMLNLLKENLNKENRYLVLGERTRKMINDRWENGLELVLIEKEDIDK